VTSEFLLDTHALLWVLEGDPRLSPKARQIVRSENSRLRVSVVSVWEIVLKDQAGKLRIGFALDELLDYVVDSGNWSLLPVLSAHVVALSKLPILHKDPFDRLLIAQAQVERLAILTASGEIRKYPVATIW